MSDIHNNPIPYSLNTPLPGLPSPPPFNNLEPHRVSRVLQRVDFQLKIPNRSIQAELPPRTTQIQKTLYRRASELGYSEKHAELLCLVALQNTPSLAALLRDIDIHEGEKRTILIELLRRWDCNKTLDFMDQASFFSRRTPQDILSDAAFFSRYGYSDLGCHTLKIDLQVFLEFPNWYEDFAATATHSNRKHLYTALIQGFYVECKKAYAAANDNDSKQLIDLLITHIESCKHSVQKYHEGCCQLLRWLADHPYSWGVIPLFTSIELLEGILFYRDLESTFPLSELPSFDTVLYGLRKNSSATICLLNLLGAASNDLNTIFSPWANALAIHPETIGNVLLQLTPEAQKKHLPLISRLLKVLKTNNTPLSTAMDMAFMITDAKARYLATLCQWIEDGDEKLAYQVCRSYSGAEPKSRRIALLALHQTNIMARAVLLLHRVIPHLYNIITTPHKRATSFTPQQSSTFMERLMKGMVEKGEKGTIRKWITARQPPREQEGESKLGIADLFFTMTPADQCLTLDLCLLIRDSAARTHLFKILATYPSTHLAHLLLEKSYDFFPLLTLEIPDAGDLDRVLDLVTALETNTLLPSLAYKLLTPADPRSFALQLQAKIPLLYDKLNRILSDPSPLAQRLIIGIAGWLRYSYQDELILSLAQFPLDLQIDASGHRTPEQERQWEYLADGLDLGCMGYIKEACQLLSLPMGSLQKRAIDACNGTKNPEALQILLTCNPSEAKTATILEALIKDPADSWLFFLLHIRSIESKKARLPHLKKDNPVTEILQKLIAEKRPYLAWQVAMGNHLPLKTAPFAAKTILPSSSENIDGCIKKVRSCYSKALQRSYKEENKEVASAPACEWLWRNDLYMEQYEEVSLAISIAKGLLQSGTLLDGSIEAVLGVISYLSPVSSYSNHLTNVLSTLNGDQDIRDKLLIHTNDPTPSATGCAIINSLLGRPVEHSIVQKDISIALLSAMLCRSRQLQDELSCFITAESSYLERIPGGLSILLDDFKAILYTGHIRYFNPQEERYQEIPVPIQHLNLEFGLPISHPLIKARELAMATLGYIASFLPIGRAQIEIFKSNGFVDCFLTQICDRHLPTPDQKIFSQENFLNQLATEFKKLSLVIFNPRESLLEGSFTGWQLTWRKGITPIKNLSDYKRLYERALKKTLTTYYKRYPEGDPNHSLVAAIDKELSFHFDSTTPLSNYLSCYLEESASITKTSDLWQCMDGGQISNLMASHIKEAKHASALIRAPSNKYMCHYLLQYCDHLPQTIRAMALAQQWFCLPMNIPKHSVNLLIHPLLCLIKKYGDATRAMEAIEAISRAQAERPLQENEGMELIDKIKKKLMLEVSEISAVNYEESMKKYPWEGMTYLSLAQTSLKEILLASNQISLHKREIIAIIDNTLWNGLPIDKSTSFFLFADALWTEKGHNNSLLAFGWSFSCNKLEVFRTTQKIEEVFLIDWDLVTEGMWQLFTPSLLYKHKTQ